MMFYIFDYFTPIFVYIVKSTMDFRISLDLLGTGTTHIAEADLYKVNTKLLSYTLHLNSIIFVLEDPTGGLSARMFQHHGGIQLFNLK